MSEWFEDQEFWTQFREHLFSEDRVERGEEQVEKIVSLLGLDGDEEILDIPCGVGRHSRVFAREGFDVTGVDISQSFVDEAHERSMDNENVAFVQGDMKDFRTEKRFDVVLNLWNSFGYFEDEADNLEVLENFYENLKDGGKLVLEVSTKATFADGDFSTKYWEEKDGTFFLQDREIVDNWRWHRMKWYKVGDGEVKQHVVKTRVYSAERIRDMLEKAGFSRIEFHGNLDGDPYDHEADELVAVAEK